MRDKTIKITIRSTSTEGIELIACAWCFSIIDIEVEYCWRCGRYFDPEIDIVDSFVNLYKYIELLNHKD